MAKTKISEFSTTPGDNTDINGINIAEGCAPSGINNAIRELMSDLKEWQSGAMDVYVVPQGTAAAPAVQFYADTDTGIYRYGANQVGVAVGGVSAGYFSSAGWNGNVNGTITGDINATTIDTTNLEVTNVKAKDGTAAFSIADSTGAVSVTTLLNVDNVRVDGNTISSTNTNGAINISPNGSGQVVISNGNIQSGQINSATIGSSTPSSGAFTTLSASSTATLNTLSSSGATLTGGTINNMAIGGVTPAAGAFTTLSATGNATLSGGTANALLYLNASKVVTSGSKLQFDGTNLTVDSSVATTFYGSITVVGNTVLDTVDAGRVDTLNLEVTNIKAKDGTAAITLADSTGAVGISTAVTMSATTQNIALGTSQTSGTFTVGGASQTGTQTFDQSTKSHTLNIGTGATEAAATKTINIGTAGISGSTTTLNIGSSVSGATSTINLNGTVNATTVNFTTLDLTNVEVTNIKAKDGTASITLADATGVATFSANPILNAGTVNGVLYLNGSKVATSGSALSFDGSNLSTTGNMTVNGTNGYNVQISGGNAYRMYATANDLVFRSVTAGSDVMTLTYGGNVGIGTTSPNRALSIYRTSAPILQLIDATSGTGSNDGLLIQQAGLDTYIENAEAGFMQFRTSATGRMHITSGGDVGIGTTSPAYKLDVSGQARALEGGTGSGDGSIIAATSAHNGNAGVLFQTNSASRWNLTTQGTNGANLRFYNYALASTVATFDSSGNLGLGVTPSAWNSSAKAFQYSTTGSVWAVAGQSRIGNNHYYDAGGTFRYLTSSAIATDLSQTSSGFAWLIAPSGTAGNAISFTQAMTLTSGGNLLVGTTTQASSSGGRIVSAEATGGGLQMAHINSGGGALYVALGGGGVATYTYTGAVGSESYTERARITSAGDFELRGGRSIKLYNAANNATSELSSDATGLTQFSHTGVVRWMNATNTGEFARITSGGDLLVGTTSAANKFVVRAAQDTGIELNSSDTNNSRLITAYDATNSRWYINSTFAGTGTTLPLTFLTGNTERARITSGGNLLVGQQTLSTTAVGAALQTSQGTNKWAFNIAGAASTSADYAHYVYSTTATAYRFLVDYAGTVFATSTTISAISDQRFKENIRDLDDGLDVVMSLKPRKFDWKEGKGKNIKGDRGFIAQEFEQVLPELVDKWADPAPEGEEPYKSVRQDLIPVLVKAIQEQQAMINELKAEVAALKGA